MINLPRPCLDCGQLHTNQTRCPQHARAAKPPPHPAYSDPMYKRSRQRIIKNHVASSGWTCPGAPDLNHEAHPCTTLTLDHIVPLSAGGTNEPNNLRVLCQSANSSKGGA